MKNLSKIIVVIFFSSISLFAEFSSDYYKGLNYMYGANMFDTNKNKQIDYKKSKMYFENSIKNHPMKDIESYFYLGNHYEYAYGVKKDLKKAFELYKQGAKLKDDSAMFALAECYRNGKGVKKNVQLSITWHKKSIEQGSIASMVNIGYIYESGEGNVHMNKIKAYEYWSKCARLDNSFTEAIEMCQSKLSHMCKENPWACK